MLALHRPSGAKQQVVQDETNGVLTVADGVFTTTILCLGSGHISRFPELCRMLKVVRCQRKMSHVSQHPSRGIISSSACISASSCRVIVASAACSNTHLSCTHRRGQNAGDVYIQGSCIEPDRPGQVQPVPISAAGCWQNNTRTILPRIPSSRFSVFDCRSCCVNTFTVQGSISLASV